MTSHQFALDPLKGCRTCLKCFRDEGTPEAARPCGSGPIRRRAEEVHPKGIADRMRNSLIPWMNCLTGPVQGYIHQCCFASVA